jgi:hypothetical protein
MLLGSKVGGYLPAVRPGILDRRASVAATHIRRCLDRFSVRRNRPPIGLVRILNMGIEKGRHCLSYVSAVANQDDESPIRISVGAPDRSLPSAPKTVLKNRIKPATSLVKILGTVLGVESRGQVDGIEPEAVWLVCPSCTDDFVDRWLRRV